MGDTERNQQQPEQQERPEPISVELDPQTGLPVHDKQTQTETTTETETTEETETEEPERTE